MRDLGEPAFGVAFGRRRIAVDGAEVALAVDQRQAQGEILRHAHQRVVDRKVAVRVELAHHLADDAGALDVFLVPVEAQLVHAEQDAPVHGLQAVAHVGQRARHDHAHGVIEVGALHLVGDGDGPDVDRALVAGRAAARGFVVVRHWCCLWLHVVRRSAFRALVGAGKDAETARMGCRENVDSAEVGRGQMTRHYRARNIAISGRSSKLRTHLRAAFSAAFLSRRRAARTPGCSASQVQEFFNASTGISSPRSRRLSSTSSMASRAIANASSSVSPAAVTTSASCGHWYSPRQAALFHGLEYNRVRARRAHLAAPCASRTAAYYMEDCTIAIPGASRRISRPNKTRCMMRPGTRVKMPAMMSAPRTAPAW